MTYLAHGYSWCILFQQQSQLLFLVLLFMFSGSIISSRLDCALSEYMNRTMLPRESSYTFLTHTILFLCQQFKGRKSILLGFSKQAYAELLDEENIKIPAWFSFNSKDGINVVSGDPISECALIAQSCKQVVAVGINCTPPRYISGLISSIRKVSLSSNALWSPACYWKEKTINYHSLGLMQKNWCMFEWSVEDPDLCLF